MSELYQLPAGWEWMRLSSLLDVQNGYAFDSKLFNEDAGCQLIRIRDLKNGIKTEVKFSGSYDNKFLVYKGDFLIGMDGDFVCYQWNGEPSLLNQRVCRLVNFNHELHARYIFYGINKYLHEIHSVTAFVTVKHISSKQIKDIQFPVPPLAEQKRIVQKLDALFARIDKAIVLLQKNIAAADNFMNSVLDDVFSDLDNKFPSKRFDTYTKLSRGHNPPKSDFIYEPRDGYIRFIQIRDGSSDDNAVYVPITPKLHIVTVDDLLLVAYRQVGKVFRGINGAFNVALCKIENVDNTNLSTDYLYYIIQSKYVKEELLSRSERALIPSMSLEHLKSILIPLPDVEVQRKVVDCLDNISVQIEKVKSAQQQKMQSLLYLKSSILDQAFHGKL